MNIPGPFVDTGCHPFADSDICHCTLCSGLGTSLVKTLKRSNFARSSVNSRNMQSSFSANYFYLLGSDENLGPLLALSTQII